jgi:membrane associated rhomboid family serine protease
MFIPIGDDNSQRRSFPLITWVITGICAYLWYRQLTSGDAFTMAWSATPQEITSGHDLVAPVAITTPEGPTIIHHVPGPRPIQLTLLSSMFLHGSWGHILGNLLYLLVFADQIEDRLGRFRFVIFYLICGLVAAIAQVAGQPHSVVPILGASGAIAGTLGAYLTTKPRNRVRVLALIFVISVPAWLVLGLWFGLQLLAIRSMDPGQVSGVAYLAHVGGFVTGAILVHVMTPRRQTNLSRP